MLVPLVKEFLTVAMEATYYRIKIVFSKYRYGGGFLKARKSTVLF